MIHDQGYMVAVMSVPTIFHELGKTNVDSYCYGGTRSLYDLLIQALFL